MCPGCLEQEATLGGRKLLPEAVREQARCQRVPRNRGRHAHIVPHATTPPEPCGRFWRFPDAFESATIPLAPEVRRLSCPLPGGFMPVDSPSQTYASPFASVIQDHLELKKQNAELAEDMPLDRYQIEDPFENHPLFKSEEQARIEETLDGEPVVELHSLALPWPGEETAENTVAPDAPALDDDLWGRSRDFDWGE